MKRKHLRLQYALSCETSASTPLPKEKKGLPWKDLMVGMGRQMDTCRELSGLARVLGEAPDVVEPTTGADHKGIHIRRSCGAG